MDKTEYKHGKIKKVSSRVDDYYELIGSNRTSKQLYLSELKGIFAALSEDQRNELNIMQVGGDHTIHNKQFLHILAQYDISTLVDQEQMKIWYDEFYIQENGIPFHKPTFYEVNAFFQELFQLNDFDYLHIFPFLQERSKTNLYVSTLVVALKRIFDYMNVKEDVFATQIHHESFEKLNYILERSEARSNTYGSMLSKLEGYDLCNYIFENDITPLFFYRMFKLVYPMPRKNILAPTMINIYTKSAMRNLEPVELMAYGGSKKRRSTHKKNRSKKNRK